MNPILECSALTIRFGGLTALNNFNLKVPSSGLVGLIGPNGAGKTTVFNLITGVYQPTSGTISIMGKNTTGKNAVEVAHMGVARTFQNIRLFSGMTVLDNLIAAATVERRGHFFSSLFNLKSATNLERKIHKKAEELLDFTGLLNYKSWPATSLPYGDQRKLEIARALMTEPKLLLLDEPAAGMNPTEKQELKKTVQDIAKKGLAILLIEHDMNFVMSLCSEITVLDYGQEICVGTPEHVQNDPKVIEAYLGGDFNATEDDYAES